MKTTHKDLIVWQKSIILVKQIYQVTRSFPHEELMGISSQMRRAQFQYLQISPKVMAEQQQKSCYISYILLWVQLLNWILKLFSVKSWALSLIWRCIKNFIN